MDISAFLKPMNEVILIYDDQSIHDALETMEKSRYTSIPIISRDGRYVGTLTEGDLLWEIKNTTQFNIKKAEKILVGQMHRLRDYESIHISENIDQLIIKASNENFVPVINDAGLFVGIVTRKTLLDYFFEHNFIVL